MGLALEVGALAFLLENDEEGASWIEADLKRLNECLAENKVEMHEEPRQLPELNWRTDLSGFPYSWTHYLRRIVAHTMRDPDWKATPLKEGEDPINDRYVLDATAEICGHFVCHSDCEGYYVPKEFYDVLFTDNGLAGGGIVGSSYRLIDELREAAPSLSIVLENGQLSDAQAELLSTVSEDDPLMIEKTVWLAFFEAARLSIEHKSLLVLQ